MPELPEVETVRRGLQPNLRGARVMAVTVHERRLRWPIAPDFEAALTGATVRDIERRSKYLLFRLQDGRTWLAHLGMTGSFVLHRAPTPPALRSHDHVDITLAMRDDTAHLRYNDPRRFGSMHVFAGRDDQQPLLAALGPEPLTAAFNADYLYAATRRRTGPIKQALMDNHLVVGVGNIYANESLFRAGIHPDRAVNRVSRARFARLVDEVKAVLLEAIAAGGSTLRDFVNSAGEPGYFQLDYTVYGRDGLPCRTCARPLKPMRHGGRATVYCGHCQR